MDGSVCKVGSSLMHNAPLSTEHPLFKAVATRTTLKMQEIMKREEIRRKSTRKMLSIVALDVEEAAVLRNVFPEFVCVEFGSWKPGHRYYHAIRNLANEWCMQQVERYTNSIAHLGGTAGIHLQSGRADVHIVGDCSDDVYAHAVHESILDASKIAKDVAAVSRTLGRVVAPFCLLEFLNGRKLAPCPKRGNCFHFNEAMVVDGSMIAMSPHQVAAAMLQTKATVTYGFFPYCPAMLIADNGRLCRTGVNFIRHGIGESEIMEFRYPEGRCGVASYPMAVWASWVREQIIVLEGMRKDNYFQLELLENRGPFMFYRMVRLESKPKPYKLAHALDLPQNKDIYTVISWRLKSVGCDPRVDSSWEKNTFTAETRLVDRVYAYGMQLSAKDFTRFAIRKQLKVVNDRVVVNGTAVTWHAPLTPDEIDQLSIAIFSKLFIDRYDSGKLSTELMARLRTMADFNQISTWRKISFIASMCLTGIWDSTLLHMDEFIRDLCDKFHKFTNKGKNLGKDIVVHRAPTYLTMETINKSWFSRMTATIVGRPSYPTAYVLSAFPGLLCKPKTVSGDKLTINSKIVFSDAVDVPGKLITAIDDDSMTAVDFSTRELDTVRQETLSLVASLNEMDYEPVDRHVDIAVNAKRKSPEIPSKPDYTLDPDPVHTFNSVYDNCFPGNSAIDSQNDMASNALDPQDRNFSAIYLSMGLDREAPKPVKIFKSKIRALNVTKRQSVFTELLSAASARNMDPPVVSKPQDFELLLPDIWRRFKLKACRPDVESVLLKFQDDPVALGENAFTKWMDQVKDQSVLLRLTKMMSESAKSMEEYDVGQYLMMIKADVKVPLSTKIQHERIEPQVIVYHDKLLSACYSSIFRVMVDRFLALLNPNVHINLRKDSKDIAGFINAMHPFDLLDTGQTVEYLENDFSKYDKSQLELVFTLEKFIFEQLGMNQTFVDMWFLGHIDCKLRSLVHAFTLHVAWQRKSGDATTAFGNVILNCMSVIYAYPTNNIYWMVFMGDDSIVCTDRLSKYDDAVKILAEVFNLQAKTYVTSAPYFASNFIVINDKARTVGLLPDPIKRIERWSMDVGELDANFEEKFVSAHDVCVLYKYKMYTEFLKILIPERYTISVGDAEAISSAIATVVTNKIKFRSLWDDQVSLSMA